MDIKRRGKKPTPYTLDHDAFDDYEKRQLRQSRTATLQRLISEAEAALARAEDAPRYKKDALRKRIDELKRLIKKRWVDDEEEQPKTQSENGGGDVKGEAGKEASNDERRHGNDEADDGQNDSRGGAKADGSDDGEADSKADSENGDGEDERSQGKASKKGENGKDGKAGQEGENGQGEASDKDRTEEDGNGENGDESGSDHEKSSGKSGSLPSRDRSSSDKSGKSGEQKPDYSKVTQHSSESGSTGDERWGQNSSSGGNQSQSGGQDQGQGGDQSQSGSQDQSKGKNSEGDQGDDSGPDEDKNDDENAPNDKDSSNKDLSNQSKNKGKSKKSEDDDTPEVQWADDGQSDDKDNDDGEDDDNSSPKIIVHRKGDRPNQGGSGGKGGKNDIHIGELPEMGGMGGMPEMNGSLPTPPKKLTVDQLINLIKPLKNKDLEQAKKALTDRLAPFRGPGKANAKNESLGEALRPIPNKVLTDFTDDEFSDMVNDVIDEMEELAGPLGVEDPGDKQARIDKIAQDLGNGSLIRELEDEDKAIVARDKQKKAAMVKAREKELRKYKDFKPISQFYIDFYRTVKDQVSIEEIDDPTMARINTRYEGSGIIKPGVRRVEERGDEIPVIDFYFDMSGSWTRDKDAIDVGKRAVRQIKEFHDKGEIKLNVFYFSDEVVNDMNSSKLGGTTQAWKNILENVKKTGAKNVVLMTDDDMDTQAARSKGLVVDGYVWFIWHGTTDGVKYIAEKLVGKLGVSQYGF